MFAKRLWTLIGLALLVPVLAQVVTRFPFSGDYRKELLQYATVERPDGKSRDIYISKAAVEAVRRGEPIPVGTVIAIDLHTASWSNGDYQKDAHGLWVRAQDDPYLHVLEKVPGEGSKAWVFGAFDPKTGQPEPGSSVPSDCLECHRSALATDMVHTFDQFVRFAQSGQVQQVYCNQPGRQLCGFIPIGKSAN
jgi:hypothetical protein